MVRGRRVDNDVPVAPGRAPGARITKSGFVRKELDMRRIIVSLAALGAAMSVGVAVADHHQDKGQGGKPKQEKVQEDLREAQREHAEHERHAQEERAARLREAEQIREEAGAGDQGDEAARLREGIGNDMGTAPEDMGQARREAVARENAEVLERERKEVSAAGDAGEAVRERVESAERARNEDGADDRLGEAGRAQERTEAKERDEE